MPFKYLVNSCLTHTILLWEWWEDCVCAVTGETPFFLLSILWMHLFKSAGVGPTGSKLTLLRPYSDAWFVGVSPCLTCDPIGSFSCWLGSWLQVALLTWLSLLTSRRFSWCGAWLLSPFFGGYPFLLAHWVPPGLVQPDGPALKSDPAPDLPTWLFLPQSPSSGLSWRLIPCFAHSGRSSYLTPTVSSSPWLLLCSVGNFSHCVKMSCLLNSGI